MTDEKKNNHHKRGFASLTQERRSEIAHRGGVAAHALGVAHEWTIEEARAAGRKGGQTVARNRLHMAEIGRKGGLARNLKPKVETT